MVRYIAANQLAEAAPGSAGAPLSQRRLLQRKIATRSCGASLGKARYFVEGACRFHKKELSSV